MSSVRTAADGARLPLFRRIGAAAFVVAAVFACHEPVYAQQALLTLSRGTGDVEVLELSAEQLEALPQVTIVTENAFVDGEVAFRGPLVRDVIDTLALGDFEILRFTAANDYSVEIPTSDFRDYDVILAMEADGRRLSLREKGPLWLMYPISDHAELRDPAYIHRLIWHVTTIEPI